MESIAKVEVCTVMELSCRWAEKLICTAHTGRRDLLSSVVTSTVARGVSEL
jgi:copper oxidase (laccase) domain-containing protein